MATAAAAAGKQPKHGVVMADASGAPTRRSAMGRQRRRGISNKNPWRYCSTAPKEQKMQHGWIYATSGRN